MTEYDFFLNLRTNLIKIEAIDKDLNICFTKTKSVNNYLENNLEQLEFFLNENIFDVEKKLKHYIKEIDLIIDHKDFMFVNLSMKYNFERSQFDKIQLNNLLIDLKSEFENSIGNFEIIHMIINKYIANNKSYSNLEDMINFDKICLEIRFICLNKKSIERLKDTLSRYQIKIKNIISYKYLQELEIFNDKDFSIIASKTLNGLNKNEIFFIKKTPQKSSFFEKFFNFFN